MKFMYIAGVCAVHLIYVNIRLLAFCSEFLQINHIVIVCNKNVNTFLLTLIEHSPYLEGIYIRDRRYINVSQHKGDSIY